MIDSVATSDAGSATDLKKPRRRSPATAGLQTPSLDRLPPHSIEAEQGVLACVLLSPQECLGQCIERFGRRSWEKDLKSDRQDPDSDPCAVFYDLRHREIYRVILEMYEAK